MLKTFTLKNGIKVATYNLPQLKSVHLRIATKSGSIVDDPGKDGVAHFMEHMLVQGTPSYPNVEELSGFIESLAGSYGAHTDSLTVNFNITVPVTHLDDAVKLASEVFFEPLFPEVALEKERRAVQNEIGQRMDSLWYKISEFLRTTRYIKGHRLTRELAGELDTIAKLTKEDLVAYWEKYFHPKNTYIILTGDMPSNIKDVLEDYFDQKSVKNFPGFPKMSNKDLSKRGIFIRHDNLQTIYVDLTFPALILESDRDLRIMQNLCFVILGRLRNSRLFKLLRYQRGLVYGVSSGSSTYPNLGYGYISSEVSAENLDEVVELIAKELANFTENGPTEEEVEFAKNYLSNQWLMSFDHPSSIAGWIEGDLVWEDMIMLPEESIKAIKKIKATDLKDLMQNYWDFKKLNLTIQGPIESSKENIQKFEKMVEILN